jgi:hypothetical protein
MEDVTMKFTKNSILLIINLIFIAVNAQKNTDKINIQFTISSQLLKSWKSQKYLDLNELQDVIEANFNQWNKKYDTFGITCQAVTPMGKYIGSFSNPDAELSNIPGGQSKSCNIWLVDNDSSDPTINQPKYPDYTRPSVIDPNAPYIDMPKNRYFAL